MTTKKRVLANRLNATHSSGPKTSEGKRAVRHNAVTHGILATDVVLPDESNEEFSQFRHEFWDYFKPVGPVEEEETRKLVNYGWRLRRCAKIDSGTFENNLEINRGSRMNTLAIAFATGAVAFSSLTRYESHLSRLYFTTLRELQRLQVARPAQPIPPPPSDIEIGLTLEQQVSDALQDFAARREEGGRPRRRRLLDELLPKGGSK